MLTSQIDLQLDYDVAGDSHFCFNVQALSTRHQFVLAESLRITHSTDPAPVLRQYLDPHGNRLIRFDAGAGQLQLHYQSTVEVATNPVPQDLAETPIAALPSDVLHFLMPSRFCPSDEMSQTAQQMFGQVSQGYQRVEHITQWIRDNIAYQPGSSNALTAAPAVLEQRAGVCRDFAHLGITLCRALNIPARLVVGYVRFEEPPQDFHAIFEVWLGTQWVRFDPTGLAPADRLARVGTGTDAKDVAFATLFGPVNMSRMAVDVVETVDDSR